ncbi:S-4TM family putative pore-forming effector [Cellulomonas biazotea]|uniref:Uncharacterized protein n=1 Tax=Cellulomonas biazotea TaxID=1709 RepID=A0A402DPH8_9CELL|nr:S-4TM family putative pore-forming effector [Cellulomonas biazotea]GCE75996.1 hypothetical protein CBZ_10520 [Cellulomonas biazotea]
MHVSIAVAQNDPHAQRLLAAQARMYSQAKTMQHARFLVVCVLAAGTVTAALLASDVRSVIGLVGGVITFVWSQLGGTREKRVVKDAAAVQEQFDTYVFELPWNDLGPVDRVDPTRIAIAAAKYRGNRTVDWYPATGAVARPLDVLICQRSNLGWGAVVHRMYAALLIATLILLVGAGIGVALAAGLSAAEWLAAVAVPLLAPAREILDLVRANRDSEDTKRKAESKIAALWRGAITRQAAVTVQDCRVVQDRLVAIRLSNAHVPDWLDQWWRSRNELAMRDTADSLIAEATKAGLVSPGA